MSKPKKASKSKHQVQESSDDLGIASTQNPTLVEKRHQQIVNGVCKVFFKKGYAMVAMASDMLFLGGAAMEEMAKIKR